VAPDGGDGVSSVLIVDDHPLVRAGLSALIGATADLRVIAEASGGAQAVDLAVEHQPDVVLMDLSMPVMDGVEATRRLLAARPGTPVVILTSFPDRNHVEGALRAGAVGYQLKDGDPAMLLTAIRSAARGEAPLDPRVARALLPIPAHARRAVLSKREEQVLRLITQGLSNKQIGARLGIAERTVKVHVGHLFRRLGVGDRTSAAMWARDNLPDERAARDDA
jgi:DNA-binding NarL/FixJ family response regulator